MNTAPDTSNDRTAPSVLVWDLPVRLVHWLMVLSFAGAWLTSESERWQLVHITLGYTMAGLVVFRVLWGLFGSRPARFASFVRGPSAALGYLKSLASGQPEHTTGHNPAGGLAIVGLLGLALLTTALGWATYAELGGDALGEAHEAMASALMALVVLHLAGVAVGSWAHRENLPRAMVTGRKRGRADEGAQRAHGLVAALVLLVVLAGWTWQWRTAPSLPWQTAQVGETANAAGGDGDDDEAAEHDGKRSHHRH